MFNGLDTTLNLGRHWRNYFAAFAALIPVFCFGQFSSNDSANLENIAYYISYLQSNHTELSDISSKLSTFDYLQDYADDSVTLLNSIATTLSSLQPGVIGPKIEAVRTAVEDVGDQVYYMRQDFKQAQRIETNLLNNAFSEIIDTLDFWGYGISNALANIQPGGAVYTNFPAIAIQTLFDNYVEDNVALSYDLIYLLTGVYPDLYGSEVENFATLLDLFGPLQRFFQDKMSVLGSPDDGEYGPYQTTYEELLYRIEQDTFAPTLEDLGELHYYEYGTRPLIQLFEQYYAQSTNDYPVLGSTIQGSGTNLTFSSSFVGAVGGLAESFTHSSGVDDDVSNVDTNPIVNIEDQGYNGKLSQVTVANMRDTSQIDAIADAVANIQNEYQSLIGINSSAQQYVFDFGTVGAFGTSKAVSFTLTRPSSAMYWNVQDFFFAVLKAIALLTTVYSIYVHIAAETEV